jgi:hypothetical protein
MVHHIANRENPNTINSGHYTSTVSHDDVKQWYHHNDAIVEPCHLAAHNDSDTAYLVVYVKESRALTVGPTGYHISWSFWHDCNNENPDNNDVVLASPLLRSTQAVLEHVVVELQRREKGLNKQLIGLSKGVIDVSRGVPKTQRNHQVIR